jgi:hypothetical protein
MQASPVLDFTPTSEFGTNLSQFCSFGFGNDPTKALWGQEIQMKITLLAAASLLSFASLGCIQAQAQTPNPQAVQYRLDQAREKARHDEEHRNLEAAHAQAHAEGINSAAEHQALHEQLGRTHADAHGGANGASDGHAGLHQQMDAAHAQAHAEGFGSAAEHQAYHDQLGQVHADAHGGPPPRTYVRTRRSARTTYRHHHHHSHSGY